MEFHDTLSDHLPLRKEDVMTKPFSDWLYRRRADLVIRNLKKNYIEGFYCTSSAEAVPKILDHIPQGAVVGLGDSMTLEETGVISRLKDGNYRLLNPWAKETLEERVEMQRQVLMSDVFVTGTNAITLNGELINVDGRGNRVAALIFGPRKVLVVVGANKIVEDVDQGIGRIKSVAAPANAKRHEFPEDRRPPCADTGFCINCKPPLTICCVQVVIRGQRLDSDRIKVFIIGEDLGL
jgi:hypothetical protein